MPEFKKFEQRAPAQQNAVDIFAGHWDSDLSFAVPGLEAGSKPLFTEDSRPSAAAHALGRDSRLDGMTVLELGPLEGAHTYALENLGAKSILAIEANVEAFLKCLIVKEICTLSKVRFMLGDFTEYLKKPSDRFDLVFCSGVLYHMEDPPTLIRSIANVTDKCFVWTHYYDPDHYPGVPRTPVKHPDGFLLYQFEYPDMDYEKFWGGNKPVASWMRKDDILKAFIEAGLNEIRIIEESPTHPNGASFTFVACRTTL